MAAVTWWRRRLVRRQPWLRGGGGRDGVGHGDEVVVGAGVVAESGLGFGRLQRRGGRGVVLAGDVAMYASISFHPI